MNLNVWCREFYCGAEYFFLMTRKTMEGLVPRWPRENPDNLNTTCYWFTVVLDNQY